MDIDELDFTHQLVVRDEKNNLPCKIVCLKASVDYGNEVAILFDKNRLDKYEFIKSSLCDNWERPSQSEIFWSDYGDDYIEFHGCLPEAQETVKGLVGIAEKEQFWIFREIIITVPESEIFYLQANSPANHAAVLSSKTEQPQLIRYLDNAINNLPAVILPMMSIVTWTSGKYWYELRTNYLSIYNEDISDLSPEEREYLTTHQSYDVRLIDTISINDESDTIRITWRNSTESAGKERILGKIIDKFGSEPPSQLRFENHSDFVSVSNALLEIVNQLHPAQNE